MDEIINGKPIKFDEYIETKTNIPVEILWGKMCDLDKITTYEEYLKWEQDNTPRFKTYPRYVPPQKTHFPMKLVFKDGKVDCIKDVMPFGATN